MENKFGDGDIVKLSGHTDWKYNNKRAGSEGQIFDLYQSDKTNEWVYEVDFNEGGLDLVHQADLELVLKYDE